MLSLFSSWKSVSWKSVYFTLHHVTIDDGCIPYIPGSFFDLPMHQDRSYSYIIARVGYHCYYMRPRVKPRLSVTNNDIL